MSDFHIQIDKLYKKLGHKQILNNQSISMNNGDTTLLYGENGAGKTTLLRIMAGLEKPNQAKIIINNQTLNWRKARQRMQKHMMYLHQFPYMLDRSVAKNLEFVLESSNLSRHDKNIQIEEALEITHLSSIAHSHAKNISGGEQKRLALARAWLRHPKILLLDEPTANMDQRSCDCTLSIFEHLKMKGVGLFIATHDNRLFEHLTVQILTLNEGILMNNNDQNKRVQFKQPRAA